MSFISKRTTAQFFNDSKMTFLVRKQSVDIIFKINRGVYLTVSVCSLSENRLLLSCSWNKFWNRLNSLRNREDVLERLKKVCPLAVKIFTNTESPHFVYLDKDRKEGAVALVIKVPVVSGSIADYLHDKVVIKAVELMEYNLNLYVELEEKCPFSAWRQDLVDLKNK